MEEVMFPTSYSPHKTEYLRHCYFTKVFCECAKYPVKASPWWDITNKSSGLALLPIKILPCFRYRYIRDEWTVTDWNEWINCILWYKCNSIQIHIYWIRMGVTKCTYLVSERCLIRSSDTENLICRHDKGTSTCKYKYKIILKFYFIFFN